MPSFVTDRPINNNGSVSSQPCSYDEKTTNELKLSSSKFSAHNNNPGSNLLNAQILSTNGRKRNCKAVFARDTEPNEQKLDAVLPSNVLSTSAHVIKVEAQNDMLIDTLNIISPLPKAPPRAASSRKRGRTAILTNPDVRSKLAAEQQQKEQNIVSKNLKASRGRPKKKK